MTDEEVVLKHLKSRVNYTKRNHGYYAFGVNLECLKSAIKALEKQIPKKPNKMWGVFCCPECGYGQDEIKKFKYCQSCGQALDWSENR